MERLESIVRGPSLCYVCANYLGVGRIIFFLGKYVKIRRTLFDVERKKNKEENGRIEQSARSFLFLYAPNFVFFAACSIPPAAWGENGKKKEEERAKKFFLSFSLPWESERWGERKRSRGRHAKEASQTGKPLSFHSPSITSSCSVSCS